jgi:pimeloyl-ACP methyl ester carboxylesterase
LGFILALIAVVPTGRADDRAAKAKEQFWHGTLKLGPGVEIRLLVHATENDKGELTATLDSPDEELTDLKLSSVVIDKSRLAFELKLTAAKYEGKMNDAGTEAAGTWTQRGAALPLTFAKTDRPPPEPKVVGPEQLWEGTLEANAGLQFRIALHLSKTENGKVVGTLDSLDQGQKGLKLSSVTLDKSQLAFTMKRAGVVYEGKVNEQGTEVVGTWSQGGGKLPLVFKKTDKLTAIVRPQTPKPPFPYKVDTVTYRNAPAGITLAGTVTEPPGSGPFPAVILISGSGAQDRDETIFQHQPFFVLADALTRRGVAVLRVDDRGVGGSTGTTSTSTSEDFAGDVRAGIAFLKSRPEIDARRIGLIGHSEGGLIAPLVAAGSSDVAFIVLMAGTGMPGDQILITQGQLIAKVMGAGKKELDQQRELQTRLFEILRSETDHEKATAAMRQVLKKLADDASAEDRKKLGDLDALIDSEVKKVQSPWFRFFLTFDPRPTLAKVKCPVLALNGEKDLQVAPKENLAEIAKALKEGGNSRVTVKELPGLNHLFQTCKTGSVAEYGTIEETIAPAALKVIGDWVLERSQNP